MEIKSTDLVSLFEKSLQKLSETKIENIGYVVQVGDTFCNIYGLMRAVYGELVKFEHGNKGIVLNLAKDYVTVFLLNSQIGVQENEIVHRTGDVFKVPVSVNLLGRVVNALGEPIDDLGPIKNSIERPIEVEIPGIVDRTPINESLETGILVIDALVPIGRGQRELIIGNRGTGKTAIAIDTILHQKGKNVLCIYVSIGQKQSNLARTVKLLEQQGALEYCIIVNADAAVSALNRYLAPYVGCTMAEYLRDQGHDVLIIYDSLSNHAVAYREMSLLMRRAPGREAYPGDVFYLHSRLLERAGKLLETGSITALPIVEVQADDITAYIPTNLISITDGQIFLDTKLFNSGIRPAVNVELSVSRVGGAAQTQAIRRMTRALRLELAQYQDLLSFSQFGSELDIISQRRLARGALIYELLKQGQYVTYNFVDQSLMLFLLQFNFLDAIELSKAKQYAQNFASYVKAVYADFYNNIYESGEILPQQLDKLMEIAKEFGSMYDHE
jgi:F-type H+/Na+-transporting ATPase subunit alpha